MKTILLIVGITLLCIIGFSAVGSLTGAGGGVGTTLVTSSINAIQVTVSGQVNKPGTYKLEYGSTVTDLLFACGGITQNADSYAFLPTHVLEAKESLYIAPLRDNTDGCAVADIVKCNINTASASELHAIAGFSNAISEVIVSYRNSSVFETIEQIKEVSGIGSATYISTRDRIRVRDEL